MIEVERIIQVDRKLADVVTYLADFGHAESWDPGTISCERIDSGPVQVGARWRNTSEFRGNTTELEYTLTRYEPQRLTFTGENKTVSATDDLTFESEGSQTHVRYAASFDFHGAAALAQPFIKSDLKKLGDDAIEKLKAVVEREIDSV